MDPHRHRPGGGDPDWADVLVGVDTRVPYATEEDVLKMAPPNNTHPYDLSCRINLETRDITLIGYHQRSGFACHLPIFAFDLRRAQDPLSGRRHGVISLVNERWNQLIRTMDAELFPRDVATRSKPSLVAPREPERALPTKDLWSHLLEG
jgi:hypothetical protein